MTEIYLFLLLYIGNFMHYFKGGRSPHRNWGRILVGHCNKSKQRFLTVGLSICLRGTTEQEGRGGESGVGFTRLSHFSLALQFPWATSSPNFSSGVVKRAKHERNASAPFLSPRLVSPFSRGVIFTRARLSRARLSLRKNGDYS